MKIKVSTDFTDAPGARYRTDGPKSGEEFLQELLMPRFLEAVSSKQKLHIDLDDVWGYASSFISGSFGQLSLEYGAEKVLAILEFKSEDNKLLVDKITQEIRSPRGKK